MEYEVIFEIAETGIRDLSFLYPGLLFFLVGVLFIAFRHRIFKKQPKWFANSFGFLLLGFAIFWTVTVGLSINSEQTALRSEYEKGNYKVVEGIVENFDPMPATGHKMERFTVRGVEFEYSDFVVTPGFNNAASRGGPLREGLPVRISYRGNTILKLETPVNVNN